MPVPPPVTTATFPSRRPIARAGPTLLLGQARLEQRLDLLRGRAPERAAGHGVLRVDLRTELVHGRVLLGLVVLRGNVERLGADADRLGRGRVRALDPAADLVPVLV